MGPKPHGRVLVGEERREDLAQTLEGDAQVKVEERRVLSAASQEHLQPKLEEAGIPLEPAKAAQPS